MPTLARPAPRCSSPVPTSGETWQGLGWKSRYGAIDPALQGKLIDWEVVGGGPCEADAHSGGALPAIAARWAPAANVSESALETAGRPARSHARPLARQGLFLVQGPQGPGCQSLARGHSYVGRALGEHRRPANRHRDTGGSRRRRSVALRHGLLRLYEPTKSEMDSRLLFHPRKGRRATPG